MERLLYRAQRIRGYGLKVEINGAKGKLLLDSGASGILINRKNGTKGWCGSRGKNGFPRYGDKAASQVYRHCQFHQNRQFSNFRDASSRLADRNSVAEEDGLLVSDVFSSFLVDIDFPKYKLHLTPLPPMAASFRRGKALVAQYPGIAVSWTGSFPKSSRISPQSIASITLLLIPTRINELPFQAFSVDTGRLQRHDLSRGRPRSPKVRSESNLKVKGLSGAVNNVFTADEITAYVFSFRQPAKDMVAFRPTSSVSIMPAWKFQVFLVLPCSIQMDLKIDYRDGLVNFSYDPTAFINVANPAIRQAVLWLERTSPTLAQ